MFSKFKSRDRSEFGFTLIEVMIAMVILSVGLLSIGVAQLSAMKMSSKSRHLSQATFIAEQQLEEFMAQPATASFYSSAVTDLADPNTTDWDLDESDDDQTAYSVLLTVEPDQPSAGLTRLTVNVTWESASAAVHEINLQGVKRRE